MESLAALFVGLVTLAHTAVPSAKLNQVLTFNPTGSQSAVLSETDETTSATNQSLDGTKSGVIRARIEKQSAERREKVSALKEKRQENQTERQAKREEFKEKLAEIKDERKQKIVEKIDERLATLNSKWVTKWNEVLERLTSILVKVETRTETAKANGKDTSEIESAISAAKSAIESAEVAVASQSEKTYTITLTSESNLGQDVKTTINAFHNDIKNTKDAVEAARKAVMTVVSLIKSVSGEEPATQ